MIADEQAMSSCVFGIVGTVDSRLGPGRPRLMPLLDLIGVYQPGTLNEGSRVLSSWTGNLSVSYYR